MTTGLNTRNSVMALVREVTENVPVSPSSGNDYIALQDGFTLTPNFTQLENEELTGSIGQAIPKKGTPEPTASLAHYWRSSGVEGQAPNYGLILEAFLGAVVAAGVERDTVAGSSVSSINVDAGEGVEFERGKALLVKDSVNGYSVRNVLSVSGDALALSHNLANAPASGVNLGRATLYKPADLGHPTMSMWVYRGNAEGGKTELMQGSRVTDLTIDAIANEFINMTYSLAGLDYKLDPIEIDSSNNKMDFNDGGVEINVSIAAGFYKHPYDLAAALETAMDAASSDTITVSYNDNDGKFTIASNGVTLELLWNTGANTAETIGSAIGFDVAADDTGATSYEADNAFSKVSPFTPIFDTKDPDVARDNEVFLSSDSTETVCFSAKQITFNGTDTKKDIPSLCAESGKEGSIINERSVSIEVVANLQLHQVKEFKDFVENQNVIFTYNSGTKIAGNWVAGQVMNIHVPTAVIQSFALEDDEGLVELRMTLQAYVSNGQGEVYFNAL